MYKVALIGKAGREVTRARAELSRHTFFNIQTFTNATNVVTALKEDQHHALVVILEHFEDKHVSLIEKFRAIQPGIPIVFLTLVPMTHLQDLVSRQKRAILLNTESDLMDLGGVLARMINGQKVANRSVRRARSLQSAKIFNAHRDSIGHGCLLDLAATGAKVRAFARDYLEGDEITLDIPLPYLKKSYRVRAKVVWARSESQIEDSRRNSQILGVKFLAVTG